MIICGLVSIKLGRFLNLTGYLQRIPRNSTEKSKVSRKLLDSFMIRCANYSLTMTKTEILLIFISSLYLNETETFKPDFVSWVSKVFPFASM